MWVQVEVQGVEGPLRAEAEAALTLRPNFAYTEKEVKDNMRRIFDIGAFKETVIDAHDTRDGVKIVFKVDLPRFVPPPPVGHTVVERFVGALLLASGKKVPLCASVRASLPFVNKNTLQGPFGGYLLPKCPRKAGHRFCRYCRKQLCASCTSYR